MTGGSTGGLEEWRPTVVVKSDMEGEEYAVVPALLKDGVRRVCYFILFLFFIFLMERRGLLFGEEDIRGVD